MEYEWIAFGGIVPTPPEAEGLHGTLLEQQMATRCRVGRDWDDPLFAEIHNDGKLNALYRPRAGDTWLHRQYNRTHKLFGRWRKVYGEAREFADFAKVLLSEEAVPIGAMTFARIEIAEGRVNIVLVLDTWDQGSVVFDERASVPQRYHFASANWLDAFPAGDGLWHNVEGNFDGQQGSS